MPLPPALLARLKKRGIVKDDTAAAQAADATSAPAPDAAAATLTITKTHTGRYLRQAVSPLNFLPLSLPSFHFLTRTFSLLSIANLIVHHWHRGQATDARMWATHSTNVRYVRMHARFFK